ncbi:MAG: ankyrin repeat domain-containing protein [Actinomycetota bacterium]
MRRGALVLVFIGLLLTGWGTDAQARSRRAAARLPETVFDAALESGFNPEPLRRLLLQVKHPNAKDSRGNSALSYAVMSGDAHLVARLLKRGADPNLATSGGRRPIHWTNFYRDDAWPVVEALLKYGAKPDVRTRDGATPLMLAAEAPNLRIVLGLLSAGADAKARDNAGASVLYYAARSDAPDLIAALLRRGAQVNVASKDGDTPLTRAVVVGNSAAVHLLLAKGARVSWQAMDGIPLFVSAVASGSPSIVRALLQRGADPNVVGVTGQPAIVEAVAGNSVEVVEALLDKGVDPNSAGEDGVTALMQAAMRGNGEIVEALLKRGADPNRKSKEGDTALKLAKKGVFGVDEELVKLLKDAGAENPGLSLREAVEAGDLEDVKSALARGEDPNQKAPVDVFGLFAAMMQRMPSMIGAEDGDAKPDSEKLMKTLVEEGLPILYLAINKAGDDPSIVGALVAKGALVDVSDPFGNTPLHTAAVSGSAELVELLVKAGARPEARDQAGNTALHSAVVGRNLPAVQKLLGLGVDREAKSKIGLTALHLALTPIREDEEILADLVTALVEAGANPNSAGPGRITPLMLLVMRPFTGGGGGEEVQPEAPAPAGSDADKALAVIRKQSRKMVQEAVQGLADGKPAEVDPKLQKAGEKLLEALPDKATGKLAQLGEKLVEALSRPTWSPLEASAYLLSKGADPNAVAEEGHTVASAAIYASTERGAPDSAMLRLLTSRGMKLNALASEKMSPLTLAAVGGDAALVNTLLWLGADPNFAEGVPALHAAVYADDPEIMRLLLRRGANPNRAFEGATPLFLAASDGDPDRVRMLLARGANPNTPSSEGVTPLRAAANERNNQVIAVLKRAGARK